MIYLGPGQVQPHYDESQIHYFSTIQKKIQPNSKVSERWTWPQGHVKVITTFIFSLIPAVVSALLITENQRGVKPIILGNHSQKVINCSLNHSICPQQLPLCGSDGKHAAN